MLETPASPPTTAFTAVIADDHAVVRDGLRTLLERSGGEFRVVGEAGDVESAVEQVRTARPDLLILDVSMPGGPSLLALPRIFDAHPEVAVVVLTMHEDPAYAREAIRGGVQGDVVKEAEPSDLLRAFRSAVTGGSYVHPRLGALLAARSDGSDTDETLSEREREVIRLVALGHTNPQIAEKLHLAERTVKTYRARAVEKLGFSSRAELTAYARRNGLTD
jgi:two-component system response regulator NreC